MYFRNLSCFSVYLLAFAQLRLHGNKENSVPNQLLNTKQSSISKTQGSHWFLAGVMFAYTRIHTHMGKHSPVTLKRVTLNYLNDQDRKRKTGWRDGATKIPKWAWGKKGSSPKTFFTCLTKHRHIYAHTPTSQCLYFGHLGCRKRNRVWPNDCWQLSFRRHILRCYLHERKD